MECSLDIPEKVAKITATSFVGGYPHSANFKITEPEGYVSVADFSLSNNGFPLDGSCVPLDTEENDYEKYGFLGNEVAPDSGILSQTCMITVACTAVPKALTILPAGGAGVEYYVNGRKYTMGEINVITAGLQQVNTIHFPRWTPFRRVSIKRVFVGQEYAWGADDIISATIDLQGSLSKDDFVCPYGEVELKVKSPVDEDAFTFAYTQNPIRIRFAGHNNAFNFYLAENGISLSEGIATIRGYDALQFLGKTIPSQFLKLTTRKWLPQQVGIAESIQAQYVKMCGISYRNDFIAIAPDKVFNGAGVYFVESAEARSAIGEAMAGGFKKLSDAPLRWEGAFTRPAISGSGSIEIYRSNQNKAAYALTTDETTAPIYDFEQVIDGYEVEARYSYHVSTRSVRATSDDEAGEHVEMTFPPTHEPRMSGQLKTIFLGLDRAVFDKGDANVVVSGHEIKERKYNIAEKGTFIKKIAGALISIAVPYRYYVAQKIGSATRMVERWGFPSASIDKCFYPSNRDFEPKTVKFTYYGHIGANIYDTYILTDLRDKKRVTMLAENVVYDVERGGMRMTVTGRVIKEEAIA